MFVTKKKSKDIVLIEIVNLLVLYHKYSKILFAKTKIYTHIKINEHGYTLYYEKLFTSIFKNLQHIYITLAFNSYLFSYVKYFFWSNNLIIVLLRYVYNEYYIIQYYLNIQKLVISYILFN